MRVRITRWSTHSTNTSILPSFPSTFRLNQLISPPRFLRWSRNTLLVIGILVLVYCGLVLLDAKIYQVYQVRQFEQQLSAVQPGFDRPSDGHESRVAAIPGRALGKIEIARIGLSAMILEGTSGQMLRRAVGHIPGTSLPGQQGNVAIAGHRDSFFRPLRKVQRNDEIILTTLEGSYHYFVDSTQVVAPEDTQVLKDSSDAILTLITCYPFYFVGPAPKRFIVRAHKIPSQM
jgi:sortase A